MVLGCVAVLLASCASTPPVAAPTGSEAPPQLEAGQTITVRYCNDQTARISAPEHFDSKAPVAVYVHGGSWISGDHDTGGFIIDQIGPALTEDGFVVANVNYRLGPDHYWPAQIEDVKCAVRYLRAHAASLRIDPDRIGAWGHSAGGHLVAMLGTRASEAGWDKGPYESESSAVEAVVDLSGPSNLTTMSTEGASGYVRDTFVEPPRTRSSRRAAPGAARSEPGALRVGWRPAVPHHSRQRGHHRLPPAVRGAATPRSRRWRPSHAGHRHGGRP